MRPLVLGLLLAAYGALFVSRPSLSGRREFDPLEPRGRQVEQLIEQSKFQAALPIADELRAAHRDAPTIAYWRAEIFHGLGDADNEAAAWEEVLRLTKLGDAACPALPRAYQRAGDSGRTIEAYQRCASAAPEDPERWLDLASSLRAAGRTGEAAEAFQRALALDPADPRIPGDIARSTGHAGPGDSHGPSPQSEEQQ